MNEEVFKAQYAVRCERCGQSIRPGETAILQTDEEAGLACFVHKRCPGAAAVHRLRWPKPPTPMTGHLRTPRLVHSLV